MKVVRSTLALVAFFAPVARAASLNVRITSAAGYSRVTVDEPKGAKLAITHRGNELFISSLASRTPAAVTGHGALILHSTSAAGEVTLQLAPSSSLRQFRIGPRRIIDVFAAVLAAPHTELQTVASAPPAHDLIPGLPDAFGATIENARPPSASQTSSSPASGQDRDKHAKPSSGSRRSQDTDTQASGGEAASRLVTTQAIAASNEPATNSPAAVLLPFSTDVGIAAIRHLRSVDIYFDEARPLDLSAFQVDPIIGRATVTMQTSFTRLTVPLSADQPIEMSRQPAGWRLRIGKAAPDFRAIKIQSAANELHFLMSAPGKVLNAVDPITGSVLMIGTDREGRSASPSAYRSTTFIVGRSEVGLVIEPLSDRLSLRPAEGGFSLLRDDGHGLASALPGSSANPTGKLFGLTRFLVFPSDATPDLLEQLKRQLLSAARTAPRARLAPRLAAAQTMIGLGLAREARVLLDVAFTDDPSAQADPHARMLRALADFLTDQNQGTSLADPALPASDETRLWRALSGPHLASPEIDASIIRETLPLLLSFPENLGATAAGLAAPILLAAATPADLDAIRRLPLTPRTAVAKATAVGLKGNCASALSQLSALANAQDMKTSSDAILASILLKSELGQMSPSAAADALATHRLDWRATGQEGDVLLREADFRRQAGQFARAFELWREIERQFPDLADKAQSAIVTTLGQLSKPNVAARMPPADFVLVVTDCARELASREQVAAELAPLLADRLEALDLPARATGILKQVIDATASGVARAELGAKLASLLLEQSNIEGARNALDRSEASTLPAPVANERHLVLARILERQGEHDAALKAIEADDSLAAQDAKAVIFANAGRWHDAKLLLQAMSVQFPARGTLERRQADQAIRLATAALRDGDIALLTRLARAVNGRFPDPDQQETFNLTTAPLMQPSPPPNAG